MNIDEFCQQMKKKTDLARQYNRWAKGACGRWYNNVLKCVKSAI